MAISIKRAGLALMRVSLVMALALVVAACSGSDDPEVDPGIDLSGPETQTDPTTTTLATTTTVDLSIYFTPLVIDQGDILVTFDRWFFVLQDPDTVVTVTRRDGTVLATGTVAGAGSIMRETTDNSFEFFDDQGQVVATVTQRELTDAANAALADRD